MDNTKEKYSPKNNWLIFRPFSIHFIFRILGLFFLSLSIFGFVMLWATQGTPIIFLFTSGSISNSVLYDWNIIISSAIISIAFILLSRK